jgi:hypothetical protein
VGAGNSRLRNSLVAKSLIKVYPEYTVFFNPDYFIFIIKYSNMHIHIVYYTWHKPFVRASFIYTTSSCQSHIHMYNQTPQLIGIAWQYIWKVHWNGSTDENYPLLIWMSSNIYWDILELYFCEGDILDLYPYPMCIMILNCGHYTKLNYWGLLYSNCDTIPLSLNYITVHTIRF